MGSLVLADGDCIEVSNLNSRILFTARGLERPKTVAEAERIKALDPDIDVLAEAKVMKADDLKGAIEECTFVLDCFDRNASRLAVNRACRNMNLPACQGFDKNFSCEVFMILPGKSACLTCALDESFPKPEKFSAVSAATDLAVVAMDSAAIRHITVIRGPMDDCWRDYDPAFTERAKRTVAKIPSCPACDCIEETAARDARLGSLSSDPRYKSRQVLGKIRRKKSPRLEGSLEGLKMILI